jgi:hypothetical protein
MIKLASRYQIREHELINDFLKRNLALIAFHEPSSLFTFGVRTVDCFHQAELLIQTVYLMVVDSAC